MLKPPTCLMLAASLLAWCLGCGGASAPTARIQDVQGAAPVDPATSGTLTVHLVQDGLPGPLSHLNLVLGALEVRVGGTWRPVPLAAPGQPVDLLAGTAQAPLLLASKAPWPAGVNDGLRFTFGPGSTVQLAAEDADTFHPLAAPQQLTGTMGLPGSFYVTVHQDTDLWITFPVGGAALPDPAAADGYVFAPGPVRGYDKAATGAISGTLAIQDGAALQGVPVTAQLEAQDGQPGAAIAFRTVVSDAEGHFTLDLLPKGRTWCAVSQPVQEGAAYYAQASPGFAMGSAPYDQYETSLSFSRAALPGSVSGTVAAAPGLGQEDGVDLVQEIPIGGVPFRFVVATAELTPQDGRLAFSFPSVPPGIYTAVLNNYTQGVDQGRVDQTEATARFAVSAGNTTTLAF